MQEKDSANYLDAKIEFLENEIVDLYNSIYKYVINNNWDQYLGNSNYLYIDFDELIKKPNDVFMNVLTYLDIEAIESIDIQYYINNYPFIQTKRPETDDYVSRLKSIILDA